MQHHIQLNLTFLSNLSFSASIWPHLLIPQNLTEIKGKWRSTKIKIMGTMLSPQIMSLLFCFSCFLFFRLDFLCDCGHYLTAFATTHHEPHDFLQNLSFRVHIKKRTILSSLIDYQDKIFYLDLALVFVLFRLDFLCDGHRLYSGRVPD